MTLSAITRPLDTDPDLTEVAGDDGVLFAREGTGFAGRGVAARIGVDEAAAFLAAIEHDDRCSSPSVAGRGPIAIGAVPFLPGSDAEFIIPQVTVGKGPDGQRWTTTIGEADIDLFADRYPTPSASTFTIEPGWAVEEYIDAVAAARDAVRSGDLAKAVIARPIVVTSDRPISIHAVLRRLTNTFGSSYRFSIDGFVGASPELLVAVDGDEVSAHPLAGTTRTTGDPAVDAQLAAELQASEKNQIEHRTAIEMVRDTLLPYCSYLDWADEPSIVKVANVQHLGSQAHGRLSQPQPSVVELMRALQPTPAVGGYPTEPALELIGRVERFERGVYGGAVGWTDGDGNGEFAVALRCAEFDEQRKSARLVAGGGIVAESDPYAELSETQAKLQAMLSALVRP